MVQSCDIFGKSSKCDSVTALVGRGHRFDTDEQDLSSHHQFTVQCVVYSCRLARTLGDKKDVIP